MYTPANATYNPSTTAACEFVNGNNVAVGIYLHALAINAREEAASPEAQRRPAVRSDLSNRTRLLPRRSARVMFPACGSAESVHQEKHLDWEAAGPLTMDAGLPVSGSAPPLMATGEGGGATGSSATV